MVDGTFPLLGRVQAVADYGTNGGTSLLRSATVPARSDTCLATASAYDAAGNPALITDPAGNPALITDPAGAATCFAFDAVGRETSRIMNCATSSSSSSSSSSASGCAPSLDTNVTILTAYNADGNVSSITAVNPLTSNQVTQYVYGTTLSDSAVASSLLKRDEILPDSVSGSDQVALN